jgi:hypothetical protein
LGLASELSALHDTSINESMENAMSDKTYTTKHYCAATGAAWKPTKVRSSASTATLDFRQPLRIASGSQQKFGVRLRPDLRAGLAGMLPSTKANGEFYGLTGETYDVRPDVETTQAKTAAP